MEELFLLFQNLNISYEKMEHKPVTTIKDAQFIKENLKGVGCKNLFLKDQKNHYYFIILPDDKKGDLKFYQNFFKTSRLSFASEKELMKQLQVLSGSVTPFALLYNDGTIPVFIDQELENKNLLFSSVVNTCTIFVTFQDLLIFLKYVKNPYFLV